MKLALALALPLLALPLRQEPTPRPPEYWLEIARGGMAVPEGEDAGALLFELAAHLGPGDPELRDDCGYGIARRWLLEERRVDAEGARRLMRRLLENLEQGLGDAGDDGVLLRSFSALGLSLVAALDLEAPFLSREELRSLLESSVAWLETERDLRA